MRPGGHASPDVRMVRVADGLRGLRRKREIPGVLVRADAGILEWAIFTSLSG